MARRESREFLFKDFVRPIVLARDKYKCKHCGSRENLLVHHMDYNNQVLNMMITLCVCCHRDEQEKEILMMAQAWIDVQKIEATWN